MRLEKPHSLSYHEDTFTSVPSDTRVRLESKIELAGLWLKSEDTSGSELYSRMPLRSELHASLTALFTSSTTVDEVNKAVREACNSDLKGILEYNSEPLVSSDFNHNPASSIFDSSLTRVSDGTLVKVSSWYDNEWGFSNRMLDVAVAFANVG